ncbi:hypothetical protein [Ascidiimonas sp. W6]|uniref:hypothetical protein n=1 Tax=Ascidiimonas meishanensis TaxID=3128903 RepID=UPI0030ECEBD7
METKIVIINRRSVWLTFGYLSNSEETCEREISKPVVCYFKLSQPRNLNYGEPIKNENEEILVFANKIEAQKEVCEILKAKIYPPNFKHPLEYTISDIAEIMHKQLVIDIGYIDSEEPTESLEGTIFYCSFAGNPSYLPMSASIKLRTNEEREVNVFEIKKIRKN